MLKHLFSILFPDNCPGCDAPFITGEKIICNLCKIKLPRTGFHNLPENAVAKSFWGKIHLHSATALFHFDKGEVVQKLLHQLKYKDNKEVGLLLGSLLANEIKDAGGYSDVDCIIPVPLHKKKLSVRGYNQSELIAEGMAATWQVQVSTDLLIRKKNTDSQTRKSRFMRFENVDKVFALDNEDVYRDKHILIVDDVITTGATIVACAEAFDHIPGCKISVASIAFAHS